MKLSIFLIALMTSVSSAQDPGPSPTASVGCEPHGDHWFVRPRPRRMLRLLLKLFINSSIQAL